LLDSLAEPPTYLLPNAAAGHTRHFMPLGTLKADKPETTLILDSFVAFKKGREPVVAGYVVWPNVDLTPEQSSLFDRCCSKIGYLGRSESWCTVTLTTTLPANDALEIVDLASHSQLDGPTVRRLAAEVSLRGDPLLRSLSETTGQMRKDRRLMPKGAKWIEYRLPPNFLMVREQFDRSDRTQPVFGPSVLRFSLERGEHSPRPSIKDAVVFSELLRAASIRRLSDRESEPATRRLAGKADDGSKREGHGHPYFLPFDSRGRGEIDGIDVWFPEGCTHPEYLAVTTVTELREHAIYDDKFALTFLGRIQRTRSRVWQSATPVVLERFPKIRGSNGNRQVIDAPDAQLQIMIRRAVGCRARVSIWEPTRGIQRSHGGHMRLDAFRRMRIRKPTPPLPVVGATLEFDEPVEGPIVLGRLAHFGLGQFEPLHA
jgi:CRISPR-associated protein Csb2